MLGSPSNNKKQAKTNNTECGVAIGEKKVKVDHAHFSNGKHCTDDVLRTKKLRLKAEQTV